MVPVRKRLRVEQGTAGKAHAGQLVHGAFTGGRGGHAAHLAQGDGHVLFGGQVVEQVEVLEDHAHLGPEGAELGLVGKVELFAFKDDLALVRGGGTGAGSWYNSRAGKT